MRVERSWRSGQGVMIELCEIKMDGKSQWYCKTGAISWPHGSDKDEAITAYHSWIKKVQANES